MTHEHQFCTQVAVNSSLVVPCHKPEIERILRVTSTPVITKIAVIDKKVIVAGHVLIYVEYVACVPGDKQPVHFVSFKAPFSDFIEHHCARPGMEAKLKVEVEFQEFHAISRRTISKLVILKICVCALEEKSCESISHPCPPCSMTPCPPEEKTEPPGPPHHSGHHCKPESDCQPEPSHHHFHKHGEHHGHYDHHNCDPKQEHSKFCSACGSRWKEKGSYCIFCGKPM